ncbi:helix-turn-helix domain-containing protein [Microbacterium sp. NPDC077184]|uniref:TetR/AcrR family transcriptional regulator n=1 Tax=Microbacterium sp. NPDC077184 TaxID=3154764 RepID=UPI003439D3B2
MILGTAMRLFAVGGFNSVSLADIAREVGITQAGVLHYFPSKAALLLAVIMAREDDNGAAMQKRRDLGEGMLDAYVGMLGDNDSQPELVQLFVVLAAESTGPGHPGHDWFAQRTEKALPGIAADFDRWIDPSKLPPGVDSTMLARWTLALSHGLGAQWVFNPTEFDRAGQVALFINLLKSFRRDPDG